MDKIKGATIFISLVSVFILFVIGYNFFNYHIYKDYPVQVFTACSSTKHNCFIADPDIADPTFQATPYSKVEIKASYAPSCLEEHTCLDFNCDGIVGDCRVTYCSEETLEEGEKCSDF